MIPSEARDHFGKKCRDHFLISQENAILVTFPKIKKNNIKHFSNRPYIGIFMSLFGGLCLYLYLVFVYIWVIFDLSGLPPSGNIGNILFILTSLRNLRLWAGHCSYLSAPLGKGANWKIRKSWDLVPTSLTPPCNE